MAETSRPHPRLPFITLTIDRPTEAEIEEVAATIKQEEFGGFPSLTASAYIDGNPVVYPYGPREADDETLFADLAHEAEVTFFEEGGGGFLHLRTKAQEAAAAGDLELLCLLAEGFGYWRGATEAHHRAKNYHEQHLDPTRGCTNQLKPLSFFDKLGDPPTILADYHERARRAAKQLTETDEDLPF